MANSSHKYFLEVNDHIMDFERLSELPNMTSFIMLTLFTGLFADEKELVQALTSLGLIEHSFNSPTISIVKRRGTPKRGYDYVYVTSDIIYKKDVRFLSAKSIEKFLFENRHKYSMLSEFFSSYLVYIDDLIENFEGKVARLEESVASKEGNAKKKALDELGKRRSSLSNFYQYDGNIREILAMIAIFSSKSYRFDSKLEMNFVSRMTNFVYGEVNYTRGKKVTSNYRGMAKLAFMVGECLRKYPGLAMPPVSSKFINERAGLLKSFRQAIENRNAQLAARREAISKDAIEPDHFMFLEGSDYDRLIDAAASDEVKSEIQEEKQNLLEQKENYNKL